MMNISDLFIDHLYSMANEAIPDRVLDQARLCAMDYVGCAAAGAKMMVERNKQFLALGSKQGGNSSVIGTEYITTLHNAAFLNAMNTHATELDDGHRLGMIHLGASIFSSLLAVAELEGRPLKCLLEWVSENLF